MKVFINPPAQFDIPAIGGIDRVVEAVTLGLPKFGVEVASSPDGADLIANHGVLCEERPGVPMVSHCHGLYWDDYDWPTWVEEANRRVVEAMRRADAVTAPSNWVGGAISRGMLVHPRTIYHGVDVREWTPDQASRFVLWNKAREDAVSNPKDMQEIAQRMTSVPFISTFGMPTSNVRIIGPVGREQMRDLVRKAEVYLVTVRETFGISTLEALSCGVPIVGWNYGGQSEIVKQGETGILVPYGEYRLLQEALEEVIANRERYSRNARMDAEERWTWDERVREYAELYRVVVQERRTSRPRVSVVVTTHNLARYLPQALTSLVDQTMRDWEGVVVDDYSQDSPREVVLSMNDARLKYIRTGQNVGLSSARNLGASKSSGKYLIFLDADDMLDRGALEVMSDALDQDSSIHIASGHLDTTNEEGTSRSRNQWPEGEFDWRAQMSHLNQIPYASMMRRRVFESVGGYRERDWRAEDASFWCRATSFGFRVKRVTDRSVLVYRFRSDSKSAQESRDHPDRDGDWTRWFPWRTGATTGKEGEETFYRGVKPNFKLVPFGAQGDPPPPHRSWPVRHHQDPVVSIIIPVGPKHQRYLVDALDSCIGQTMPLWEVIVVDDSPEPSIPEVIPSHPFARVLYSQGTGAGRARNIGLLNARGAFAFFLDADDIIDPETLEEMLSAYLRNEGYIYSDCKIPKDPSRLDLGYDPLEAADYDQHEFILRGYSDNLPGAHSVSVLISMADILQIDGTTQLFDETLAYWEDWEAVGLRLAAHGLRGTRIPKPLLTYRYSTGFRRQASFVQEGTLREALRVRYQPYATGEKEMCACGGGSGGSWASGSASRGLSSMRLPTPASEGTSVERFVQDGKVRLRYVGERFGAISYKGEKTRKVYRFGREPQSEVQDVEPEDAPAFMRSGDFEIIDVPQMVETAWR